jgi:hypothetical protein
MYPFPLGETFLAHRIPPSTGIPEFFPLPETLMPRGQGDIPPSLWEKPTVLTGSFSSPLCKFSSNCSVCTLFFFPILGVKVSFADSSRLPFCYLQHFPNVFPLGGSMRPGDKVTFPSLQGIGRLDPSSKVKKGDFFTQLFCMHSFVLSPPPPELKVHVKFL